jgi:hypothetical protein
MYQRLKLEYDEPLSNFAFNFKLRCYHKVYFAPSNVENVGGLTDENKH